MFKVSPAILQTFIIDTPNCVLEDRQDQGALDWH
jgi:hypothetical protein